MLLAIDAGNTNTLFAIHDGTAWRAQWRTSTSTIRTADEYIIWLTQLMALKGLKPADINRCVISTVVPQSLFHLRNLSRRYFGIDPLVVGDDQDVDLGIGVNIDNPKEAGADRLVNAIGGHVAYPGALLIIDSGTATTFDVISSAGDFEGGVIAPGINLSLIALHNAAAKLPRIEIRRPAHAIGRNTVEAMQSGVFWGYIALIEGMCARIQLEYPEKLTVVATGGVASLFEGATNAIHHFDHDLTIRGLLEIHARNAHVADDRRKRFKAD
ncbi:type III pantothenate kinase [Futiania mangrovi]|uniref:Type III pantothenate kinase n=1 Tax=Futiania mangrovi TaxID=2959716 RepID=A0A9J6PG73_9PROT|nr:type III pantothenate kinase [Futiania mangrovii]MCP1335607.1 type III pantothenate kinase [Futiania mangrovii]